MKLREEFLTHNTFYEQIMISCDSSLFSGLVHSNKTAAYIIDLLKEEIDKKDLINKLLNKYDVEKDVLEKDLEEILNSLREINALDE